MAPPSGVRAILFDVFGTVVDWRGSLIADLGPWGAARGIAADWALLADRWRAAYQPSLDRVRRGLAPWANLDALHRETLLRLVEEFGIGGLDDADLDHINRVWHRLRPWPDALAGLTRLRRRHIVATLSNGNVALLLDMAKGAGLPWDMIGSAELFRHYKPDPETYLGMAALLGLAPGEVMMAAAHNRDLAAARALGLATAFVPRPHEYGPGQTQDLAPAEAWDVIATDIDDLATRLGC